MSDFAVSDELAAKVRRLFPRDVELVIGVLECACGATLPGIAPGHDELVERIRCAVLRLSQGSLERLTRAVDAARVDWRDVIAAAGFGEDADAHRAWLTGR